MSFKIHLVDQNIIFEIKDNETILEAALRQGHNLPYGCRNGACGSCKAKLISGEISYPGGVLPEAISEQKHLQGDVLLCQARALNDISIKTRTIETSADISIRQFPCRVSTCEKLNPDVIRLILELPKTERLQFLPGQYVDIIMREGKRRSFSIANAPHQDQIIELHIRHYEGGLFSEYAFKELKERAILRVEGPLGQFTLQESDRPIIMIAGGTGFAPVKSLIEYSLTKKDTRPINFYWGARTEIDLYLDSMAKQWAREFKHIKYVPVLSDTEHANSWTGRTGYVHEVILQDYPELSTYDIYACGPPPMINAIVETFPKHGLNKERLFSDSFEFAAI